MEKIGKDLFDQHSFWHFLSSPVCLGKFNSIAKPREPVFMLESYQPVSPWVVLILYFVFQS